MENANIIKSTIRDHFKSFFTKEDILRPKLKCQNLVKLTQEEKVELEWMFSEAEIWEVIKSRDGNKAPAGSISPSSSISGR